MRSNFAEAMQWKEVSAGVQTQANRGSVARRLLGCHVLMYARRPDTGGQLRNLFFYLVFVTPIICFRTIRCSRLDQGVGDALAAVVNGDVKGCPTASVSDIDTRPSSDK
jgi:hypothetical protein